MGATQLEPIISTKQDPIQNQSQENTKSTSSYRFRDVKLSLEQETKEEIVIRISQLALIFKKKIQNKQEM